MSPSLTVAARGATVTVSEESIVIERSALGQVLWPGSTWSFSDLIGWYIQVPTATSPGSLELLSPDERTRVFFSPGQATECETLDAALAAVHAGYGLAGMAGTSDSEAEADAQGDAPAAPAVPAETPASPAAAASSPANPASPASPAAKNAKTKHSSQPAPWEKVSTPEEIPEPNPEADITNPFYGHTVCVTGAFEPYDKAEVWSMLAQRGATVAKNVTKKTTMLIIGEWASVTSKEKRARQLQEQGQEITLLAFEDFLTQAGVTDSASD